MSPFFLVFVAGRGSLTIPDAEASVETIWNLESVGFELVWDSAPTAFIGAKYAFDFYGADHVTHRRSS